MPPITQSMPSHPVQEQSASGGQVATSVAVARQPIFDRSDVIAPGLGDASGGQARRIAPRSALSYVTRNDASARKYLIQPLCGGVA